VGVACLRKKPRCPRDREISLMRLDQGTRLFARLGHVNPIKNIPCFGVAGLTPFLVNGHPWSP